MAGADPRQTSVLVRRAVGGDGDALGWLAGHLDPLLRAQVRARLGPAAAGGADVDDVVAETWAVTLQRLGDIRPAGDRFAPTFVAFLSRTAANLCNRHLRRRIRQRLARDEPRESEAPPLVDRIEDPTRGVVTRVDGRDVRAAVSEALERLAAPQREVLVLRLFEQRGNAEVAERLGVTPNTAAVRYRRALVALRERLPRGIYEGLRELTFGAGRDAGGIRG